MGYNCNFEREGREASRRCSRPSLLTDMVCVVSVHVATQTYVVATTCSRFLPVHVDHHGHVVASDLLASTNFIDRRRKKVGLEPQGLAKNGLRPMKRERNRKPRKNASAFDEIALDGIKNRKFCNT